eukprot:GILI01031891.1.p1 GENE.GILI01031891.1~~GILI01031891.1.p1  ORF type:complete len:225 (-),score=25.47 GILI01031891.1:51-725(-)
MLNRSSTPTMRNRTNSPRATRSPFRNVFQLKPPTSADSILNDLSISFDDKVIIIVRRRAEQIMSRYVRLNYLGREDGSVLEGCRSQCENFMSNVENCIRAAAKRDESMSQSIVRRAYDQWKICNDLSAQITIVLEGRSKKRAVTPPRAHPQRSFVDPNSSQQGGDLEELKTLQRLKLVDKDTASRIYDLCVAIYGPEKGHVEFVAWLSLMPPSAMQSLAEHLSL